MYRRDSSSVGASMEKMRSKGNSRRRRNGGVSAEEEGDPAMWETLDRNFRQVQTVLDRNRVLIQQVNENHQSKMADNMAKNVSLIRELNGNISKVASMYADLNTSFTTMFHQNNNQDRGDGLGGGGASARA